VVAGTNAGSVYASQYPGVASGEAMSAQTSGIQAGLEQEQANNTLNVGNYNASMETLQDVQSIGNTAESFNAGGVLPQGSPMAVLNQQRELAAAGIGQTMQQAGLQATMQNTQANATINASRAQLLGVANDYTQGLENADITQENADVQDFTGIFGPALSAGSAAAGKGIGTAVGNAVLSLFS
jgi:hypothetical protein